MPTCSSCGKTGVLVSHAVDAVPLCRECFDADPGPWCESCAAYGVPRRPVEPLEGQTVELCACCRPDLEDRDELGPEDLEILEKWAAHGMRAAVPMPEGRRILQLIALARDRDRLAARLAGRPTLISGPSPSRPWRGEMHPEILWSWITRLEAWFQRWPEWSSWNMAELLAIRRDLGLEEPGFWWRDTCPACAELRRVGVVISRRMAREILPGAPCRRCVTRVRRGLADRQETVHLHQTRYHRDLLAWPRDCPEPCERCGLVWTWEQLEHRVVWALWRRSLLSEAGDALVVALRQLVANGMLRAAR